jgi:hypothetical protein
MKNISNNEILNKYMNVHLFTFFIDKEIMDIIYAV